MESSSASYDGQKVYKPWLLNIYDFYVLWFSNRFLWKCPSKHLSAAYQRYGSKHHLDIGVGSGYFLEKWLEKQDAPLSRITLLDLNMNSLTFTRDRLAKFTVPLTIQQGDILQKLYLKDKFDSIAINYLLHCLPGSMPEKAPVFENIKNLLKPQGVCFGATIINDYQNALAKKVARAYNRRGIFSNCDDTYEGLEALLKQFFKTVKIQQVGSVVLFAAVNE